jgi:hypothetical protein
MTEIRSPVGAAGFENWNLVLAWNLGFGIWDFISSFHGWSYRDTGNLL